MHRLVLAFTAVIFAAAPAVAAGICAMPSAQSAKVDTLAWLAGNWIQQDTGETVRERWAGPYGNVLLGVGVTTKGDTARSYEFFRIARSGGGISYFASPNAAAPTEFKAIELCSTRVVFENKSHDFPQRVIYWHEGNGALHARIEGMLKGKLEGEDWTYRREP